jgi:hypothetical protein
LKTLENFDFFKNSFQNQEHKTLSKTSPNS